MGEIKRDSWLSRHVDSILSMLMFVAVVAAAVAFLCLWMAVSNCVAEAMDPNMESTWPFMPGGHYGK